MKMNAVLVVAMLLPGAVGSAAPSSREFTRRGGRLAIVAPLAKALEEFAGVKVCDGRDAYHVVRVYSARIGSRRLDGVLHDAEKEVLVWEITIAQLQSVSPSFRVEKDSNSRYGSLFLGELEVQDWEFYEAGDWACTDSRIKEVLQRFAEARKMAYADSRQKSTQEKFDRLRKELKELESKPFD